MPVVSEKQKMFFIVAFFKKTPKSPRMLTNPHGNRKTMKHSPLNRPSRTQPEIWHKKKGKVNARFKTENTKSWHHQ
jgi:hypothetical protein